MNNAGLYSHIAKFLERLTPIGPMPLYHAVFSFNAAMEYGSGIWLHEDGTEVHVTCADYDLDNIYRLYRWPDNIYVGRVVRRLRQGWPDTTMKPTVHLDWNYTIDA